MAQCKEQSMQGEDEVFACNGFYAVYICSCLLTLWDGLLGPSSRVKQSKKNYQCVLHPA